MNEADNERVLDHQTMLALDRARWLCGGHVGPLPEVLPPDVEREAVEAFRRLAQWLKDTSMSVLPATIQAVIYALREDGIAALNQPDCQRRLRELDYEQIKAVLVSLVRLRPEHPNITDELLDRIAMGAVRRGSRGR